MMKTDNTLERTIFFGKIDWRLKKKDVDVFDIFNKINKLTFADGSRYYQASDGQRYAVLLEKLSSSRDTIYGCIGDSRITNLPFLEKQGSITPLKIAKGEGIFDAMHFLIKKNSKGSWVIAYEFNFYAPRIGSINIYTLNKLAGYIDYVAIEPISGESVNQLLRKFKQIKKVRMRVHSGADVNDLSVGLADALAAMRRAQDGVYIDIACSVGRSRDKALSGNLIDNIPRFFKTMGPQSGMEHFYISGIRSDTGQFDEADLMDIVLKERRHVERIDKDYRFINPQMMYAALTEAYNAQRHVIDRV